LAAAVCSTFAQRALVLVSGLHAGTACRQSSVFPDCGLAPCPQAPL